MMTYVYYDVNNLKETLLEYENCCTPRYMVYTGHF